MKTTLNIPEELLKKACELSGASTKTEAVVIALEDLVRRREVERLLELAGTLHFSTDEELDEARHDR